MERRFRSCFVSHSSRDAEFVEKLVTNLRAAGVRVWFAPEDLKAGEKLGEQIDKAVLTFDRLLVVLSPNSISSAWVATEIRNAYHRELIEKVRVLFPISLLPFAVLRDWTLLDSDSGTDLATELREYFIPDFQNWRSEPAFRSAFQKLIAGLSAE